MWRSKENGYFLVKTRKFLIELHLFFRQRNITYHGLCLRIIKELSSRHIYLLNECENGGRMLLKRNSKPFMETEGSLPYSQQHNTGLCPQTFEFGQISYVIFFKNILQYLPTIFRFLSLTLSLIYSDKILHESHLSLHWMLYIFCPSYTSVFMFVCII